MPKPKTRNKFERRIEGQLKKAKISFEYESQRIPYTIPGNYIPDFVIDQSDGHRVYLETKGHFRVDAKRKMAAVKRQHPDLDIRILFYSYKLKDVRWATKHGFPFAVGTLPEEWLNA